MTRMKPAGITTTKESVTMWTSHTDPGRGMMAAGFSRGW